MQPARRGPIAFLEAGISRGALLAFILPAASVSYFGSLALAIGLRPGLHDWRSTTISKLALYPEGNPACHWIASAGIALAGALIIPFAGYIGRRLRLAAPTGSRIGEALFRFGAAGAVLVGVVAYHADALLPRLHTLIARGSAFALCASMIVFWACALKGRLGPDAARQGCPPALFACWSVLVLSFVLGVALSAVETGRQFGRLAGLFEWGASAIFLLFLLSSALLLPQEAVAAKADCEDPGFAS
jgi:hypothetical protein